MSFNGKEESSRFFFLVLFCFKKLLTADILSLPEAYSEPCQIFKMRGFVKKVNVLSRLIFLPNASPQMFDRVLDTPLHIYFDVLDSNTNLR